MSACFGTAIAAIWTPKRIVVAADGKQILSDGEASSGSVKKINAAGDMFFSMAGLVSSDEAAFDAARIITEALQEPGSFKKKVKNVTEKIEEPLQRAVQHVHDNKAGEFKKYLAGRHALDILFFAKDGADMALSQVAFKTKRRGKAVAFELQQRTYPNPDTGIMSVELIAAGAGDSVVKEFLANTTEQEALVYPEQALKKFMDLAIAAEPEHAGYPVSMVKLAADGPTHTTLQKP